MERQRQTGRGLEHLRTLPQPGWYSPSSILPLAQEALPRPGPSLTTRSGHQDLDTHPRTPATPKTDPGQGEGAGEADESRPRPRTGQDTAPTGRAQLTCLNQDEPSWYLPHRPGQAKASRAKQKAGARTWGTLSVARARTHFLREH